MGLFVQFGLQNLTIRTKKDAKNSHGAVGVVEAASSSLVTQTISSVHNESDEHSIFFAYISSFGAVFLLFFYAVVGR